MVKKLDSNYEGSDFDTDDSVSGVNKTDKWAGNVDPMGSISAEPEEYHDNPGEPEQPKRALVSREMETSSPSQGDLNLFAVVFTTAQVTGIVCIVLVWIWMGEYLGGFSWSSNPKLQFNYHPLFMVIGMIFLYGNAILVYRVLRNTRKLTLKLFHAGLHILVFTFTVVALKAVFDYHNNNNIPNLYTLHSWMGLGTVILFAAQYVFGFFTFLYPGLAKSLRMRILPVHIFSGLFIFILAVGCCITGITGKLIWTLKDGYGTLVPPAALANSLGLCIVIFAVLVVFLATSSRFKRQPLPEEAMLQLEPQSPAY